MPSNKIILTPEQEEYLADNFATVIHYTLCQHLGISKRSLTRFARERGLVKDMKAIEGQRRDRLSKALKKSESMRRRKPTWAVNGAATRFKKGYSAIEFFGEEKFMEMHRKSVETRRRIFTEDKIRVSWGLPQKTRMRVIHQPRQKVLDRCYLKRRGYVLDEPNCIAYWTDETRRCTRLEAKPKRYYKFMKHPECNE